MDLKKITPNIEGKVGLIVGGSRGIGASVAQACLALGAKVIVASHNQARLDSFAANLPPGSACKTIAADMSDPDDMERAVAFTVSNFGKLDFAFNNAGGAHPMAKLDKLSIEDFDACIALNLRGTFAAMKAEIKAMLQSGGGSIVNNSSSAGLVGVSNISGYAAAKSGVIGLSKAAALEYAKVNIRVNVIAPGPILTEMVLESGMSEKGFEAWGSAPPMKRPGSPDEVTGAVLWLISDASSYVTGVTIPVDGGYVLP